MTATRMSRTSRKGSEMPDEKALIARQEAAAYEEQRKAGERLRAARRELRKRQLEYTEANSKWYTLASLKSAIEQAEAQEVSDAAIGKVDPETGIRVSRTIFRLLEHSSEGCTLSEIADVLSPHVAKPLISATLYNMKKRNEIVHNDANGKYRTAKSSVTTTTRLPIPR